MGLDDDFADAGTATFERERDLSIQNNIRDLIDQITRAIQRIDDGQYGTCERCGQSDRGGAAPGASARLAVHGLQEPRRARPLSLYVVLLVTAAVVVVVDQVTKHWRSTV